MLIRSQNLAAYIRASLEQWLGQYHHVVGLHLAVAALWGHRCAADAITPAEYAFERF